VAKDRKLSSTKCNYLLDGNLAVVHECYLRKQLKILMFFVCRSIVVHRFK
jgi:hypothetical protein